MLFHFNGLSKIHVESLWGAAHITITCYYIKLKLSKLLQNVIREYTSDQMGYMKNEIFPEN